MDMADKAMTTCCLFGHREIEETAELQQRIYAIVKDLILNEKVDTFLFGSKSQFDDLCHRQVTKLKAIYPHVKRIYVRAEFPVIGETYRAYLLEHYEDTYYPEKVRNAGRAVYVERNREMVNNSQFCIIYYRRDHLPTSRKSGTKSALEYAYRKNKRIFLLP